MKICKEFILYFKEAIIIILIGTLLHFAYTLSNGNLFIALFSGVNESTWEHIKIAVMAVYIFAFVKMWLEEKREKNLWTALLFKVLTIIVLIPTIYYTYINILGYGLLWVDILIFVISIFIAQIVEVLVKKKLIVSKKIEDKCMYLNLGVILMFIIFTFIPPKFKIFLDETTNKYGV